MRRVDRMADRETLAALAAEVRAACVRAALEAYEDAGVRGLCEAGRWECAVDAVRRLDLTPFVEGAGD